MKVLQEPVVFEWNEGNIEKNVIKHDVTTKEAEEAVTNEPTFLFIDEGHSKMEKRHGLYGRTDNGRRLSIVFTIRMGKVRIITARDMSKKERRAYEKIKTDSSI